MIPDASSSSVAILDLSGNTNLSRIPLLVFTVSPFGCSLFFTLSQNLCPQEEIEIKDKSKATPTHSVAINRVKLVIPFENIYHEINSGSAYQDHVNNLHDPENTIVFPLILFCDGTVVDGAHRKPLEPISFTFGIFRQHARAQPNAWRVLGYIKNNPEVLFTPEEIKEGNLFKKKNELKKINPAFVKDTRREYHSQITVALDGLRKIQKFCKGMKIRIPWVKGIYREFDFEVPVLLIMGDTAGHDKLCCIQNHQKANLICRMCNVTRECLDDPKFRYKLRDSRVLQNYFRNNNFHEILNMGYWPCKENILLDLQYCDLRGMNMALPPESMHVICLGYMPHLVQGLSCVQKLNSKAGSKNDADRGTHYVFGEQYKRDSRYEAKLIEIGELLQKQPDPDKPRTAFSTYLIDPDPTKTCKTGKKQAHEMRGVLLTILYYLVMTESMTELDVLMGQAKLSEYIKLFDLMLLLESFLTSPLLTQEEVDAAENFIPAFIEDFCKCVAREQGNKMRLVKIHLLNHFMECIRMFGSAVNFNGAVGESHLKNKTKEPARRTKMKLKDMEYQTAVKDYEQIVLEHGYQEVLDSRDEKNVIRTKNNKVRLGRRYYVWSVEGEIKIKELTHKKKKSDDVFCDWKGCLNGIALKNYLESNGLTNLLLHTEADVGTCKLNGHPAKNRQDWIEVLVENEIFQVQCLIFFHLPERLTNEIVTPLHTVQDPGTYAIVHFLGVDIFGEPSDYLSLYGTPQRNFYQHEDCFLIRGWSKETVDINETIDVAEDIEPILAMINVSSFQRCLTGIQDIGSDYPHSWLFVPERKCWKDAFVIRMSHDEKKGKRKEKK